jgi:N-methylhydantoinase B
MRETAGDRRALVAANATGGRRIGALIDRLGRATIAQGIEELVAYAERRARAEIGQLPRGVFRAEGVVDNDGFTDQPVRLAAAITIGADGIEFDLTGCDTQRRAPVNSTYAQTFSACAYVLKCLIDPDVPANAGLYRLVRVIAPLGTVVNCAPPSPVVGGWETHLRLVDVLFMALAPALPRLIPAGTKGTICHAGFGGIDPRRSAASSPGGEYYCFLETVGGGYGGRPGADGPDAVQPHGQNTENAPIEETELNYPVLIERYELIPDSEGAGQFRGGLGLRRDYRFEGSTTFTVLADRDRWGPHGLFGGQAGAPARYVLDPGGEARRLSSKTTLELEPGQVISYQTCGGGHGEPRARDPELVRRDVREGKVSAERARQVYGVDAG